MERLKAMDSLVKDYRESLFSQNRLDRELMDIEINSLEVEDYMLFVMTLDEMERNEYMYGVALDGPCAVAEGDTDALSVAPGGQEVPNPWQQAVNILAILAVAWIVVSWVVTGEVVR